MINKRGVSAVVATVLIVMITVAAVGLLWGIVSPFLKTSVADKTACVEAEISLSVDSGSAYTCVDSSNGVSVRVARGSDDNSWKAVSIVYTDSVGNSQKFDYAYPPEKNSEKVFRNVDITDVASISVYPVLSGNGDDLVCSKTIDLPSIKSCSSEVSATLTESSWNYQVCNSGQVDYHGQSILCLDGLVGYWSFDSDWNPDSGVNLIENPSMDSDTWWTKGTNWVIENGVAKVTDSVSSSLYRSSIITIGKKYYAEFEIVNITAGGIRMCAGIGAGCSGYFTEEGVYHEELIGSGDTLFRLNPSSGTDVWVDNVVLKDFGTATVAIDSTDNANDGSYANGAFVDSDDVSSGYYASFDGVDDYVVISDSDSLDISTSDITLSAWINPLDCIGAGDGRQTVVTKSSAYYFNLDNCVPEFYWYDLVSAGYHMSDVAVNTSEWSFVVATYNSSIDLVRVYVNGVETKEVSVTGTGRIGTSALRIGGIGIDNRNFNGTIDDVMIFDRALSEEEVDEIYRIGR